MAWSIGKPIVVPFDFSEHAMEAVRKALELASDPSLVDCLHVLPFIIPTEPGVAWGVVDDGERMRQALETMQTQLPVSKFGNLKIDVRFGDPGSVVADRAKELDAELIVIGSHGRSGLVRLMLGSVAEQVTRLAPCPVLVVKLQPHAVEAPEASKSGTPQVAIA
jgi:nucleotide-binding universal stress UspA family protein